MDFWIQAAPRRTHGEASDWQQIVYRRISSCHAQIRSYHRTLAAEKGLNFHPSAYFYIGRCDPSFSEHVLIFSRPTSQESQVTPFDTGGFWHDHVCTHPPTPPLDKPAFVESHSFGVEDYYQQFCRWGREAFPNASDYIWGTTSPQTLYALQINLDNNNPDSRCWTWEGRVSKATCYGRLATIKLFLQDIRYRQYTTWVRNNPSILAEDAIAHLRLVSEIYSDAGQLSARDAACSWIEENGAWDGDL